MSDAPETHILSSLSSDFARFILGDLQRLRTELAAAEQKAKTAERKLEQERNKRLKADERAENLQKEKETIESRIDQSKKETPAKTSTIRVAELEKRLRQSDQLLEAEKNRTKEAEDRFNAEQTRLEDLISKLSSRLKDLEPFDPWRYVELRPAPDDLTVPRPSALAVFNGRPRQFVEGAIIGSHMDRSKFLYRRDICWAPGSKRNHYGVTFYPSRLICWSSSRSRFHWERNNVNLVDGDFELVTWFSSHWVYAGTFRCTTYDGNVSPKCFSSSSIGFTMVENLRRIMTRETIVNERLTPPIVRDVVSSMYEEGVLNLSCTVFERVGFNQGIADALSRGRADIQQAEVVDPRRITSPPLNREEPQPPKVISSSCLKRKRSDSLTLLGSSS